MAIISVVKAHQFPISTSEQASVQGQNNFLELEGANKEILQALNILYTLLYWYWP